MNSIITIQCHNASSYSIDKIDKLRYKKLRYRCCDLGHEWSNDNNMIHFLPEASFGLRVLSLPASVCLCVSVRVCVCQPRACPRHKSSRIQARTTKFGQKVQNNLVKVPIVLGGNWPRPSRSNFTWKAKFTPFWAYPRHNSPSIQARTTKLGHKMQTNLLMFPIVLGGDWPRSSW